MSIYTYLRVRRFPRRSRSATNNYQLLMAWLVDCRTETAVATIPHADNTNAHGNCDRNLDSAADLIADGQFAWFPMIRDASALVLPCLVICGINSTCSSAGLTELKVTNTKLYKRFWNSIVITIGHFEKWSSTAERGNRKGWRPTQKWN